jgi:hypothetical protein
MAMRTCIDRKLKAHVSLKAATGRMDTINGASRDFYLAHIQDLPTTFQRHIQNAGEFHDWAGFLEMMWLYPANRPGVKAEGFVAELVLHIRHNTPNNKRLVELNYLLGPTGNVQQVAKRDLSNINDIMWFKPIIQEWIGNIAHTTKERATTQTRALKEDLMAAAWAPARVAAWVNAGRYDMLD